MTAVEPGRHRIGAVLDQLHARDFDRVPGAVLKEAQAGEKKAVFLRALGGEVFDVFHHMVPARLQGLRAVPGVVDVGGFVQGDGVAAGVGGGHGQVDAELAHLAVVVHPDPGFHPVAIAVFPALAVRNASDVGFQPCLPFVQQGDAACVGGVGFHDVGFAAREAGGRVGRGVLHRDGGGGDFPGVLRRFGVVRVEEGHLVRHRHAGQLRGGHGHPEARGIGAVLLDDQGLQGLQPRALAAVDEQLAHVVPAFLEGLRARRHVVDVAAVHLLVPLVAEAVDGAEVHVKAHQADDHQPGGAFEPDPHIQHPAGGVGVQLEHVAVEAVEGHAAAVVGVVALEVVGRAVRRAALPGLQGRQIAHRFDRVPGGGLLRLGHVRLILAGGGIDEDVLACFGENGRRFGPGPHPVGCEQAGQQSRGRRSRQQALGVLSAHSGLPPLV